MEVDIYIDEILLCLYYLFDRFDVFYNSLSVAIELKYYKVNNFLVHVYK